MSKKEHDAQKKAAVMAALLAGQSVSSIAREYEVPRGTVSGWKARELGTIATVATEKKEKIGALLITYMNESLTTLIEQTKHFRNVDWLRKQSADSLAVLHGVQADKLMRMIEALDRAESTD